MTERPAREDIRRAGASGRARSAFVDAARQAVRECREGRAASACMADIGVALERLDARRPQDSGRRHG